MTDTIPKQLQQIVEEMCDGYCKKPMEYLAKIKDPDEAHEEMWHECCRTCPLSRLL